MTSKRTIYVEATALVRAKKTGVDYYVQGLIGHVAAGMPKTNFVCFYFPELGRKLSIVGDNIIPMPIKDRSYKRYKMQLLLGIAPPLEKVLGVNKIETAIFPNFYSFPINNPTVTILPIIYDTTYLDTPDYVDTKNRIFLKKLVKKTAQKATKIITISESSRKCLQKHYGRPDSDYTVIYPAPSTAVNYLKNKTIKLPDKYLLFLGTLEPRKNVANLIKAHRELDESIRKEYPLVLAGSKGWRDEAILDLLTIKDKYIFQLGYVAEDQKAAIYEGAYAFVYPAVYEGFGMPVVEAMLAGLPVITCRNSSLPEAGGDAAIYCDETVAGIRDGMLACIHDSSRQQRILSGKKQATKFNWDKSASQLESLL